jgi:hypothetical protein
LHRGRPLIFDRIRFGFDERDGNALLDQSQRHDGADRTGSHDDNAIVSL